MGTEKRARQKANRQLKLEEQEKAEKKDKYRQYGLMAGLVVVAIVGGLALINFASGDDDPPSLEAGADTATTIDQSTVDPTPDNASDDTGADAGSDTDDGGAMDDDADEGPEPIDCPAEDGSSDRLVEFPAAPPPCTDPSATYVATFDTNLGTITAELDAEKAPNTVNNFVYLARYHYYDGTSFHRIINDFMIQGGDATGNPPGTGGPGYTINEEVPEAGEYQVGSLAMAKRNPPGTTGAQFFIVTGPNGEGLPPLYSLFGQVTEGLDVVEAIEALPTDAGDAPTEEIVVNSVTITEA